MTSEVVINQANAVSMVEECAKCMQMEMWPQFKSLYKQLNQYYNQNYKDKSEEDGFTRIWIALKSLSIDNILNNVQNCANYDDYIGYLKSIKELIDDPEHLWEIVHTEIHTIFKATPQQARQIANMLFTPIQLFYFSLNPFLESELCDLTNVKTEELVIDRFYALAGFVRACGLKDKTKVPEKYLDYVSKLLHIFVNLPDFSAKKFVWLVEMIYAHLHIEKEILLNICASAIETFDKREMPVLDKIVYFGRFSTSPLMSILPNLKQHITETFTKVVEFYKVFSKKYIVPSFADLQWIGKETGLPSDPLRCWYMYISNLIKVSQDCPIKRRCLEVYIDQCLQFFTDYYGEVQPTIERSHDVRRDIFSIMDHLQEWNFTYSEDSYHNIWLLLLIATILGAEQAIISNLPSPTKTNKSIMLGLEVDESGYNFRDYKLAFSVLLDKFKDEKETIPDMIRFFRENFK